MKNIWLSTAVAVLLMSCTKVKPEGDISINELPLENFNKIDGKGKFRVFLILSDQNKIEVETYTNVYKNLDIKVKDGVLNLGENRPTQGVDFYNISIYSKDYPNAISLADSIDFNISGDLKAQNLVLNLKDNAKFIGAINTDKTEVDMQNTSIANIKGFTKMANLKLKDTVGLIAPFWTVDEINIDAKNHIYAEVHAKNRLSGNLTDTSKMLFYNNPEKKFKHSAKTNIQNKNLE